MRKQGEGSRDNLRHGLNDISLKLITAVGTRQSLTLRGNYYSEDSNVTYSGLREDEYQQNPRQNPFRNDFFYGDRHGASATHSIVMNQKAILTTNIYGSIFNRHWWRQSSNSGQRPNNSSNPACGGMENLNTTCGIEGRLRRYTTWGVEPHLRFSHGLFGLRSDTDFGFRAHFENQDRRQENGARPTSRTGTIVESNVRKNEAYSVFLQNRFVAGKLALTPGIRVERIDYQRTNNLANGGAGITGETDVTQFVPGLGLAYSLREDPGL
jgi:Fe(3+) dicitrate transport protein